MNAQTPHAIYCFHSMQIEQFDEADEAEEQMKLKTKRMRPIRYDQQQSAPKNSADVDNQDKVRERADYERKKRIASLAQEKLRQHDECGSPNSSYEAAEYEDYSDLVGVDVNEEI